MNFLQDMLLLIFELQFVMVYYIYYTHACKQYAPDIYVQEAQLPQK